MPPDERDGSGGPGDSRDELLLAWLTGPSCDGCTIKAVGGRAHGGIETLLQGAVDGFPPVRLLHPLLFPGEGRDLLRLLEGAADGEAGPYALVNEASVPTEPERGSFSLLGEHGSGGSIAHWLDRLAPGAEFVVAWGDCGVWGGPHSLEPNPTGATGTSMYLGEEYRSRMELPVVNLPGCPPAAPLVEVLVDLLRWRAGEGEAIDLDELNQPTRYYSERWKGAFGTWSG